MEQDWGMFEGTGLVKGKILYEKEYEHLQVILYLFYLPKLHYAAIPSLILLRGPYSLLYSHDLSCPPLPSSPLIAFSNPDADSEAPQG